MSPGDVLRYPLSNMIAAFGKPGYYIWHRINGLEQDEIASDEDPPKSFGHSWVLNFRTTDKRQLAPVVLRLAEKAARRMRRHDFKARGFYLAVATADGQYLHHSKKLDYQIETGYELYEAAMVMWKDWRLAADATQVAVGFFRLIERHEQLPLFGKSSRELNDSLDLINDKYGEFTVRSGMLVHSETYAPDAIAFGL
jgi:DNA polymerase IV